MKMIKLKTYQEEFDASLEEIKQAEAIWNTPFPEDYKAFLLKNNGVVVYPNFPRIETDNNELWRIKRFMSVGDLILQKKSTMEYTLNEEHHPEDLNKLNLSLDFLLTFALGEMGCYYINLDPKEFGQIYFCNYCDAAGLVRITINSFSDFIESLYVPKDEEEHYDPNFEFTKLYYPGNKIFDEMFFRTNENPELGLERFKEVLTRFRTLEPPKEIHRTVAQTYAFDRLKLEFLLKEGCSTEGLLNYANNPEIIKYLIAEIGLDINKPFRGKYPLEGYLRMATQYSFGNQYYQLIDGLLELGIEIDWSVLDDTDEPLIKMLEKSHELYLKREIEDKKWWIEEGRPSGHVPPKRSKWIEAKLGIKNNDA